MNGLDSIKIYTALFGYLVAAPLLGYLISRDRRLQSWTFGLLVFLASCHINKITFMIDSIEWYRGATKGFEVSLLIVVALALLIGQALGGRISRPWLAPGAALYLLYVAASLVSIFAAPDKTYVWMATLRFFQPVIIYMAAFHFFQDADDLRFLMKSLVVTLCIQMVVVVKMKYLNHIYQVMGWFEHQNALAMWALRPRDPAPADRSHDHGFDWNRGHRHQLQHHPPSFRGKPEPGELRTAPASGRDLEAHASRLSNRCRLE